MIATKKDPVHPFFQKEDKDITQKNQSNKLNNKTQVSSKVFKNNSKTNLKK